MRGRWLAPLLLCAGLGCGSDSTLVGDDTGTGTGSETGPDSDTGSESESTGGDDGGTETGDGEPFCGDGEIDWELEEECDDGNRDETDGCTSECKSACGLELAGNLVLEDRDEWFEVMSMGSGPGPAITAYGHVETPNDVGRLRAISFDEEQPGVPLQDIEGPVLGPSGTPQTPQTHQLIGLAVAGDGDLLGIGYSTELIDPNEDPVEQSWLARFSGADLSEIWRVPVPVAAAGPEFRPRGIAVLADGDVVVVQTEIVAEVDHDIGVRRHAFADGAEIWATRHSGELDGGYSLDEAWHAAVGEGDHLWVSGLVRRNYETHDTTVYELSPDDGSVVRVLVPLPDPGGNHRQRPWSLAAGAQGDVVVGLTVYGPAAKFSFSRSYRYSGNEQVWELGPANLPWDDGEPYIDPRVAIDDDGNVLVSGTYTHQFMFSTAARVWTAKLGPEGEMLCSARIGQGNDGGNVPRNGFFGSGRAALNLDAFGAGGMGPGSGANWIIGLRE